MSKILLVEDNESIILGLEYLLKEVYLMSEKWSTL